MVLAIGILPHKITAQSLEQRFNEVFEQYHFLDANEVIDRVNTLKEESCALPDHKTICFRSYDILVRYHTVDSRYEKAEQLLNEMKEQLSETEDRPTHEALYLSRSLIFLNIMNRLDETPAYQERLTEILNNHRDFLDVDILLQVNNSLGYSEHHNGNYSNALAWYKNALDEAGRASSTNELTAIRLRVHNNLGVTYTSMSELELAREQYERSLELTHALYGSKHQQMILLYNNLGSLLYRQGNAERAGDYFLQSAAAAIDIMGPESSQVATAYNNAGVAFYTLGNYTRAATYLEEAQRVKESIYGMEHMETAVGYHNLGTIYLQNNEVETAEQNFMRSIEVRRAIFGDDHPDLIAPLLSLGSFYRDQGQPGRALRMYREAEQIGLLRLGAGHPTVMEIHTLLAGVYATMGDPDMAANYYRGAIEGVLPGIRFEQPLEVAGIIQKPGELLQAFHGLAGALQQAGEPEHALQVYRRGSEVMDYVQRTVRSEASSQAILNRNFQLYTDAIHVLYELVENDGNERWKRDLFDFSERSRSRFAHALIREVEAKSYANVSDDLLAQEREMIAELASLQQQLAEALTADAHMDESEEVRNLRRAIFEKRSRQEQFLTELEQTVPEYYRLKYDSRRAVVEDVQGRLSADERFLSYVVTEQAVYAMVIGRDFFDAKKVTGTHTLDEQVPALRHAVLQEDADAYISLARSLYAKLMEPLEEWIEGHSLIISADGVLHHLPFDLLLTEAPTGISYHQLPYLLHRQAVSYVPSASMFMSLQDRRVASPRNLYSTAPFYLESDDGTQPAMLPTTYRDRPFSPLLLSGFETNKIAEAFSERRHWLDYLRRPHRVTVKQGPEAVKASFLSEGIESYNFIHLATHAVINEEQPELSAIAFYPEEEEHMLYVDDIYALSLNADLVTLSACDTGGGTLARGEGIVGFTRAFMYAGAANLNVSLWRVSDVASSRLMVQFYNHVMAGRPYSESLRLAKLAMIQNPDLAAPAHWAAFVLYGR